MAVLGLRVGRSGVKGQPQIGVCSEVVAFFVLRFLAS